MTGDPITTRHEKRSHANHLFAMSYGSFLGSVLTSVRFSFAFSGDDECYRDFSEPAVAKRTAILRIALEDGRILKLASDIRATAC